MDNGVPATLNFVRSTDRRLNETGGEIRLLVIDDSPLIRLFIEQIFVEHGIVVRCAESGLQGLDLARRENFDIILCDVLLMDVEGFEVCRRLKADPATARIPIVLISTEANASFVRRGLEVAEEYIGKPLDADALLARVRSMLRQKDMMDQILSMNQELDARVEARTAELLNANLQLSAEILERKRSEEAVNELSADLLIAREKEREKIAADLHDDLGQSIFALKLNLQNSLQGNEILKPIVKQIDAIAGKVRTVSRRLSPILSAGILDVIKQMIASFPRNPDSPAIRMVYDQEQKSILESYWNINLFRAIQEAVTNAVRHAMASHIEIRFERVGQLTRITIADDGIGISKTPVAPGMGLTTMKHRVVAEGGNFWIESETNKRTEICFELEIR